MARPNDRLTAQAARKPWLLQHTGRFVVIELAVLACVVSVLIGGLTAYLIGSAILLLTLVLVVPVHGRSLARLVALRIAYARRKPAIVEDDDVPTDLVPLAEWVPGLSVSLTVTGRGEEVGVITDGKAWTAVLALNSDDELIADAGEDIDLSALSGLTTQDDVVFAGVQVVTYTVPAPTTVMLGPDSTAARAYGEITADPPPPTIRRTWLCLRLDPRLCLEAVARRGVDNDGIYATLRFGLHRVQTVLKRQGIETRALDPMEIFDVLALTAGAGPDHDGERSRERWQHWQCDGFLHSGRVVRRWGRRPSEGYGRLLGIVAQAPVLFAVTSFTLSPGRAASGGLRLVSPNAESAARAVEHVTGALDGGVGLAPPGGTQVATVLATVPLGRGVAA